MEFLKSRWKSISFAVILFFADIVLAKSGTSLAPTYHLDGAFQTFSGLNRLLQGDVIARDFIPYLGSGPLLSVFIPFIVFGGNLISSVIAAKFLSLIIFQGIVYFIFKQLNPSPRTRTPMVATLAFTCLLFALYTPELIHIPQFLRANDFIETVLSASQPGWSLRPIRASAPYVFIATIFVLQRFSSDKRRPYYALIALGALTAMWSNDYAIPTALVFLTQQLYSSVADRNYATCARLLLTFVASWFSTTSLYTFGNPAAIIKYNFFDVPNTQFWYFGPWLADTRVFSLLDLAKILTNENVWLSLVVLLGLIGRALISKKKSNSHLISAGLVAFIGGLVATVGGHAGGYFWSFKFWSYIVLSALGVKFIYDYSRRAKWRETLKAALLGSVATILATVAIVVTIKDSNQTKELSESQEYFYSEIIGGYLPVEFVNLRQSTSHGDVIEEYYGITSTLGRYEAGGTRVDSIIHALGSEREKYEQIITSYKGKVITTSPSMDSAWTSWNFSANWWFYKNLILNFSPRETSPNTISWKFDPSTNSKITKVSIDCRIDQKNKKVVFVSEVAGLYELQIIQDPDLQRSRSYAMIENNINFAGDSNAYLAVPPNDEVVRLPFFADGLRELDIKTIGGFNLAALSSCSLSEVKLSPSQAAIYEQFFGVSLVPVQLTDSNWTRGFNNSRAGFFVSRKRENLLPYRNAEIIQFNDGDSRRVKKVEMIDSYINVWLEGAQFTKTREFSNFKIILKNGTVIE